MVRLSVNVNKIATLRNARGGTVPDVGRAVRAIVAAGRGVIVLLHRTESPQELRRRAIAGDSSPSQKMDLRNYGIGAQILRDLHVGKMRLLARPRKMPSMAGFDLEVTGYDEAPPARTAS